LFDEPTTGLDPITSTTIEDLINTITEKVGATTVVVTHQISTILRTSQKIVMIHDGKAIKTEGPKKILKSKNPRVYRFVNGVVEV
jgi:phospholipid/cholesterol/gamma-HCH transport system ATP-binding protein